MDGLSTGEVLVNSLAGCTVWMFCRTSAFVRWDQKERGYIIFVFVVRRARESGIHRFGVGS